MSAVDPDKVVAFVLDTKDPVLSRLALYANGGCGREDVINALATCQRDDGGWTRTDKDFKGDLSIISATCVAVQWLNWIGDRNSSVLTDTVDYLRGTQREDGSWDEPDEIVDFNPPFWMLPGQSENRVWLTSALCCKLKEAGREQQVDFAKALEFIRQAWDGEKFPVYQHTHWMAMPLLSLIGTGDEADEIIIRGCRDVLYDAVATGRADPGDTISIAYASHLAGEVAEDLFEVSLEKVRGFQQDDGGWITNHGEEHRAAFTVEALFLFKRIGAI
ncbi:MAG: terpene cyclase/mutase family protein [Gemmatimonadota bacterium]|nr:terpene cyclase/mutase family protein [Gemmatimonadota bacterium]